MHSIRDADDAIPITAPYRQQCNRVDTGVHPTKANGTGVTACAAADQRSGNGYVAGLTLPSLSTACTPKK